MNEHGKIGFAGHLMNGGRWGIGVPRCLSVAVASVLFMACVARGQTSDSPALAQRFAELSRSTLRTPQIGKYAWQQAIELLEAASRLDPTEARYARLLVDAQLHVQDAAGAEAALKAYRKLRPDDRVAQVKLIDLYVGRIQTADAKLNYIQLLLKDQTLAAAVRSHVAVLAARVQGASLRRDQAAESIDEALKLNPLNMDALRMRYDTFDASTPVSQRVGTLLAMLKSNPGELWAAQGLARQLADEGLVDLSVEWYRRSTRLQRQLNQPMTPAFAVAYAAELYVFDQPQLASSLLQGLLNAYPSDMDGLYLSMLCTRRNGTQADMAQISAQAVNAAMNRLAEAYAAAQKTTATTRPLNSPPPEIPDFSSQVSDMKSAPQADRDAYVSALSDLAWIELYFKNDAEAAGRVIDAMSRLVPSDSVVLDRLQGWKLIREKQPAQAKVKLSAAADRDPMAKLGLIALDPAAAQAKDYAKELLKDDPSGLIGAFVWDEVRNMGVQRPTSADAEAIRKQVQEFPRQWLDILDQPKQFYSVQFDPVRVSHDYTDPLIAQVTVRNVGDQDLTVGAEGVIHSDLWIDAQLRGLNQQNLPGVAFEQLSDRLVLHPGESISRSFRVDQGSLDGLLKSDPGEPIQVAAAVITNPVITPGGAVAGPAGQRAELGRIFQRNGFAMNGEADKQRLFDQLRNSDSEKKIQAASLLAAYIQIFQSDKATDDMKQAARQMLEVLRKAGNDADPAVAAWASYLHARIAGEQMRWAEVQDMAGDSSWMQRLLALVAVQTLSKDQQRQLARPMAQSDDDATVKAYAATVVQSAAATQPTTQK